MRAGVPALSIAACALFGLFSCSGDDEGGSSASGGAGPNPGGGAQGTGASWGTGSSEGTGGTDMTPSGGTSPTGGSKSGGSGSGGGGASGGAENGDGGMGNATTCAMLPPLQDGPTFDCGSQGEVFQNSGRPDNRVNYVIVGDGYTSALLDTVYLDHITNMLEHEQGMFGDLGEPYRRYRQFINICALKVESQDDCVDDLDTNLSCDTVFDGYGDDASRLGIVSENLVYSTISDLLPDSIDVDWVGVTINAGPDNWWNSGGSVMVWNGGYQPAGRAASVALHEGGHSFHGLADEYDGTSNNCGFAPEPNVSTDDSGADWSEWLGFDHDPGSGLHGSYEGARYCGSGVYRPTGNSEMNLLPDYFNMPSIQKMIHDIYEIVDPIDAHTDDATPLVDPVALQVRVVDPEVIRLSWFVDEVEQPEASDAPCFSLQGIPPGEHVVEARAFDETPWVRDTREDLERTITWTVTLSAP